MRILVLAELSQRAKIKQNALVIVDFLTAEEALLDELFQAPTLKIRAYTCVLIGNIASHASTRDTTLLCEPCSPIVRLLRCVIQVSESRNIYGSLPIGTQSSTFEMRPCSRSSRLAFHRTVPRQL